MINFALLGHPAHYDHVADLLARLRPGMGAEKAYAHKKSLGKAFEWSSTFAANEELIVPMADGSQLRGKLIICTFLPEHAHSPKQMAAAYQKTRDGVRIAKQMGARIVGLGGFTSIIGGTLGDRLPYEFGIATTSGNTLTAALALGQIKSLLSKLHWTLAGQTVAVLGASGDIGRACTQALATQLQVKRLILIARNRAKLEAMKFDLQATDRGQTEILVSTRVAEARRAELIITATSAAGPLLSEADLMPGTIVCDIGYPHTLAYAPEPRPEVLLFHGGLAEAPFELPITHYSLLPRPDILYGCFTETIALAMAGRYESYSLGQGRITLERMQAILDLAQSFGFRPAPLYRGNRLITDDDIAAFGRYAAALREDR
ncbi:MAG: hypothetical protein AABZ58_02710 [Chloroflexota bacterium]